MAQAQKPDFIFPWNWWVHLNWWGRQFIRLVAVAGCGSVGSDCIMFSEYVDHRLKMSLQAGKKRVKRSGEREIVYNVYKFMKTESEVGITIPLSKVQKRVVEATRVSRRTLCRMLKEGESVETDDAMAFSTLHKHRTKFLLFSCYLCFLCYLCCSMYCSCVNIYCSTATECHRNCSWQIYHII